MPETGRVNTRLFRPISGWKPRADFASGQFALARRFGASAEMWARLQADYNLQLVRSVKARTNGREVEPRVAFHSAMVCA